MLPSTAILKLKFDEALVLRPVLVFGVVGLGWHPPEYPKGVVNRTPSRPSSTPGTCHSTPKLNMDKALAPQA